MSPSFMTSVSIGFESSVASVNVMHINQIKIKEIMFLNNVVVTSYVVHTARNMFVDI